MQHDTLETVLRRNRKLAMAAVKKHAALDAIGDVSTYIGNTIRFNVWRNVKSHVLNHALLNSVGRTDSQLEAAFKSLEQL